MLATIARRYLYEGTVQGVGFRRTTEEFAMNFRVTGYVMNRSDGSVEMHVEGPIHEIDHFADRVQTTFKGRIARVSQELVEPGPYDNFGVAFEKIRRIEL